VPPVALVPAQASDVEALADIRVAAMRESLERAGRFDPKKARARFTDGFVAEHTRHVVAHGQRVGVVVIRPNEGEWLLDHLYFLPEQQGKGYGAEVLRLVFSQADAANKAVRVGALKGSRSNDFYVRHGFELVEAAAWDNYYVRPAGASRAPSNRLQ
jgi:GNAT superfamily N-acetyltransferase